MRLGKTIAACAVSVLGMVFSVQQGEHGPLVVYKLEAPERAVTAAPPFTVPEEFAKGQPLINPQSGETVTLQDVSNDVQWRRDTVQKLRGTPFAPRF